jgi:hypothetical protein
VLAQGWVVGSGTHTQAAHTDTHLELDGQGREVRPVSSQSLSDHHSHRHTREVLAFAQQDLLQVLGEPALQGGYEADGRGHEQPWLRS